MRVAEMLNIIALFTLLLMSGCRAEPVRDAYTDRAFYSYVADFEQEWGHDVVSLSMHFVDSIGDSASTVGQCSFDIGSFRNKEIVIDRNWWDDNPDSNYRKILIFHELAHCFLKRSHTSKCFVDDAAPVSIMHPYVNAPMDFWDDRSDYYLRELFGRTAPRGETVVCVNEESL